MIVYGPGLSDLPPRHTGKTLPKNNTRKSAQSRAKERARANTLGKQRIETFYNSRYSEKVKLLRVILPVTALLMLAILLIWPLFSGRHGGVSDVDAGAIAMLNAKFVGVDAKNRPMTITADQVVRTEDKTGVISLKMPVAELAYAPGRNIAIRAENGQYEEQSGHMYLDGDVNLFQSGAFELVTRAVEIDGKNRNAWSVDRVTGYSPNARIAAEGLKIINNGQSIVFTGKSRLVLTHPDKLGDGLTGNADSGLNGGVPQDTNKPGVLEQKLRSP